MEFLAKQATQAIVAAILNSVKESTTRSQPSPRSVPGWTKECKEAQQHARRLRRKYQSKRTPEAWETYRQARNHKARLIKRTLRDYHRRKIKRCNKLHRGSLEDSKVGSEQRATISMRTTTPMTGWANGNGCDQEA